VEHRRRGRRRWRDRRKLWTFDANGALYTRDDGLDGLTKGAGEVIERALSSLFTHMKSKVFTMCIPESISESRYREDEKIKI
jgi:hypothetical protein